MINPFTQLVCLYNCIYDFANNLKGFLALVQTLKRRAKIKITLISTKMDNQSKDKNSSCM